MSFKSTRSKVIASIAVVGTVAAVVALAGFNSSSGAGSMGGRNLQAAPSDNEDNKAFQGFVTKHNRNYLTKEEYNARLKIFSDNLGIIRKHDAAAEGYKIGLNKFADLSPAEFEKMMGFKPLEESNTTALNDKFLDTSDDPAEEFVDNDTVEDDDTITGRGLQSYPASLDWRTLGVLNPIRNQGSCGSCFTFSAVSSLEALYKVKKGSLPQLSEQQILDCSGSFGNKGCSGGLMTNSFNYLKTSKAMTRASYAYTAVKGTCKYNAATGVINTTGYKNIAKGDPNAHIAAL